MADFPFDIVGFDLDGTLVDSAGDLAAAVNHMLAAAGRSPFPVDVRAAQAAGVPVATFGMVADADAVFDRYADLLPTLRRMAPAPPLG